MNARPQAKRSGLLDCYAQCAPGIESFVARELTELGIKARPAGQGGVSWRGTARQLYLANAFSRLASRVLVRIAKFRAHNFPALIRKAEEIPWGAWLGAECKPVFRVTSRASQLYHEDAIAERLTAVVGGAGVREQLFVVRVKSDEFAISVDASGEPLHKRGWRQATAKAPLRETLAAAMIRASCWKFDVPLIDPLCGSGTIAIEAALLAAGRVPGLSREFAFQKWPEFQPGTWASVLAQAKEQVREVTVPIVASDRDVGAVAATIENAERAGVDGIVRAEAASISDLAPPEAPFGWLLTNPPYGGRIQGGDLRNLYARFGDVLRDRLPGWRIGMLSPDRRLTGHTRLKWKPGFATKNGGISVTFLTTRIPRH